MRWMKYKVVGPKTTANCKPSKVVYMFGLCYAGSGLVGKSMISRIMQICVRGSEPCKSKT